MLRHAVLIAALAAGCASTHAADILHARYDAASDQIVAEIAYRGTNADHDFTIQWDRCQPGDPARLAGRLVDAQGRDVARQDYRITERIALDDMPCRPAIVTLRLGRTAHTDVFVPRHIELLGGAPARPYEAIGEIEARGSPGEHRRYVHQELRNKARALGADAVIEIVERSEMERVPGREGSEDLLGNAYPGVVHRALPGSLPAYGFDVQSGGRYYELRGLAVRYTDEESS